MFRTAIFIVLLSVAATSSLAQSSRRHPQSAAVSAQQKQRLADDMQSINALHDRDIRASMALDADELERLWTDDIVTIHPGSPPIVGLEANSKRLRDSVEQMKSVEILAYNEDFQEVRISGDYAFEYGTMTGRTRPFNGGQETSFRFNVLRVLQRLPDGTWKIARSIYNDAVPQAQPKPPEQPQPKQDENKLKQ